MQGARIRVPAQCSSDTQHTKTLVYCIAFVPWFVLLSCHAWRPPQDSHFQVEHWRHERSRFKAYERNVSRMAIVTKMWLPHLTNAPFGKTCTALTHLANSFFGTCLSWLLRTTCVFLAIATRSKVWQPWR